MKKTIKGITVLLLIALVVLLLPACAKSVPAPAPSPAPAPALVPTLAPAPAAVTVPAPKSAHPIVQINNLVGGRGTSSGLLGSAIEDLLKKHHPWLRWPVGVTVGSAYVTKLIEKNPSMWENSTSDCTFEQIYAQENGLAPFDDGKIFGWVPLINRFSAAVWLVSFDPNIKTFNDIVGKRVALGAKVQTLGCMGVETAALLGIPDLWSKAKVTYSGGYSQAITALIDGTTDIAVVAGYTSPLTKEFSPMAPFIELLATGRKIYSIPVTEEMMKKVNKTFPLDYWTMPADPQLGHHQPTMTLLQHLGWEVKPVFPEDVAYELVKFWIDYYGKLKDYTAEGKLVDPRNYGLVNRVYKMHPGALRALDEAGVKYPAYAGK